MATELEEKYLTGILWQDFQHTKLISLLEKLNKSKKEGTDSNVFDYAIAFLAMYVNDHFDLEEAYMKEYGFHDTDFHIAEHKDFIKKVKELRTNHSQHSDAAMDILINNITQWIKNHIMKDDIMLGRFIASKEKEKYNAESDIKMQDQG